MKVPVLNEGSWQELFRHALTLMDEVSWRGKSNPFWTFGGGTVLMLRHGHCVNKDIDIFVPDPQFLGYVTPRLSDVAAGVTQDYARGLKYGACAPRDLTHNRSQRLEVCCSSLYR